MTLSTDIVLDERYRIDGLLSEGGMGAIYRGYDLKLDIPVAIKENFFSTPQSIEQFRQEARILARLHHPNLPRVIDHFTFDSKQYLVMDFIDGEDLWEIFESRKEPFDEQEVLSYIIQICDAVDYLHRQNPPIIHRDIKPQNIKITPDGRAVLVDFGIAKVVELEGRTRTGAQAITPGFSPPEQYGGMGTSPVSDVYSLGATLYALLTGRYPPDSVSIMAGGAKFEPPAVVNSKLSRQVSQAIEHAMQIRQDQRPQSVAAWQNELKTVRAEQLSTVPLTENGEDAGGTVLLAGTMQVLPPLPVSEPASSVAPTAAGQPDKTGLPWPWISLAVLALIIAIGTVVFVAGRTGTPGPSPAIDTEAILIALAATATAQAGAGITQPSVDLEATLAAVAATATAQTQLQAVHSADNPTPTPTLEPTATPAPPTETPTPSPTATSVSPTSTPTVATPAPIIAPVQSPTATVSSTISSRISFVSWRDGNQEIYLMNPDGSQQRNLSNDPANNDRAPTWSPDGQRIAFASSNFAERPTVANSSIRIINTDGSGLVTLATQSARPVWTPDGAQLAVHAQDGRIFVISAENGEGRQLTQGIGFNPAWSPDGHQLAFDDRSDLYLINRDGTGLTRLTASAADETQPAWSPDGQRIAFVSNGEGNNEIYVMGVDDSNTVRLTTNAADDRAPTWSPDGAKIAFATNRNGNWDIYVMNADGTDSINLTRNPADDDQPAWSPF